MTAQTRECVRLALVSVLVAARQQQQDFAAGKPVQPLVLQECGSQRCETCFGFGRSATQQNTGSQSAGASRHKWAWQPFAE